jgi:CBS domain-containing protein
MKISDILRYKGSTVHTIAPASPVTDLLAQLAEYRVGALIVADGKQVAGIVSERDVVRRLHERGAAVLDSSVADLMTNAVHTCSSHDSVDSVAETMTERRIRHMPVIDDGELKGIVSIGDVVSIRIRQLEKEAGQLEQYITG